MKAGYLILLLFGFACGIGVYAFFYAHSFSHLSADPNACVNCHIMRPQYDNWLKSSHHTAAGCRDCRILSSLVPKYLAKAEDLTASALMIQSP